MENSIKWAQYRFVTEIYERNQPVRPTLRPYVGSIHVSPYEFLLGRQRSATRRFGVRARSFGEHIGRALLEVCDRPYTFFQYLEKCRFFFGRIYFWNESLSPQGRALAEEVDKADAVVQRSVLIVAGFCGVHMWLS